MIFYRFWLSCLICSCFIACDPQISSQDDMNPNIILIVSEDNSQDLGCYGNTTVHTPNLDSLAFNGAMFMNAYTTYSVCSPSRASIFTGLYPHQNGQIGLATHKFRMYDYFDNIPKYLKSKGYRTGCLGKLHVNPDDAIPFDFHELTTSNFAKKNLQDYAIQATEFIKSGDAPYFLMVNYPDAHFPLIREVEGLPTKVVEGSEVNSTLPFVGADSERLRELTADYYSQINRMDECVGLLLDSLNAIEMTENTLIIYISDHGAQFSRGKGSNYEGGLKIPMVWHWPGKIKPQTVYEEELTSVIDIFPSIIDAIGDTSQIELPGHSLFPLFKEEKYEGHDYIFAEGALGTAKFFYPRRSVRDARYKLIYNLYSPDPDPYFPVYTDHNYSFMVSGTGRQEIAESSKEIQRIYDIWENPPKYELYDLVNDPWEFVNLAENPKYTAELNRMKQVLKVWRQDTRDPMSNPVLFDKMRRETDSINTLYPEHSYQKDSTFKWNYPKYFGDYVLKE